MTEKSKAEKRISGASYIYNFYSEIINLNENYSLYLCIKQEFEQQYPSLEDQYKAAEDIKTLIKNTIQNLKHSINKVQIAYRALHAALKGKMSTEHEVIMRLYDNIQKQYTPNFEDLDMYIVMINESLLTDIVQELLTSSHELIQSMFSDNATNTTTQ